MDRSISIMFTIVTVIAIAVTYDAVQKGIWYVPVVVIIAIGLMIIPIWFGWFSKEPKKQEIG